jgi:Tfp pilus assembly protein PilF
MYWHKFALIGFICAMSAAGLAQDGPARPGSSAAAAAPIPGGFMHQTTETEKAVIEEITHFDANADRLARCLHYPDPRDVHWDHREVELLCHFQFDPLLSLGQLQQTFDAKGPKALERYFDGLLKDQAHVETAWKLDEAFLRTFACECKEARDLADAWLARSPDNVWAHVASGLQHVVAAGEARGGASSQDTSQERFARMEQLDARGAEDLQRSLVAIPNLTPATYGMLWVEARDGDRLKARDRLEKALHEHPGNFMLHEEAAKLLQRKWVGSDADLVAEQERARATSANNPLLILIVSQIEWTRRSCGDECAWSTADLEAMNQIGPSLPVMRQIAQRRIHGGDLAGGAIYATEVLRMSPTYEAPTRTQRGMARLWLNDVKGAEADAEAALAARPGLETALQLMQMITSRHDMESGKGPFKLRKPTTI